MSTAAKFAIAGAVSALLVEAGTHFLGDAVHDPVARVVAAGILSGLATWATLKLVGV